MNSGPPFAFAVPLGQIPPRGKHFRIAPDESARRAMAEALGIVEVAELSGELEVRPMGAEAFSVRGTLTATVVQTDVVTLEPVRQEVSEAIDLTLLPADDAVRGAAARRSRSRDDSDDRDVYRGGNIDLGAIVVEHLALGLDPYPRSPDVEFPGHIEDDSGRRRLAFCGARQAEARPGIAARRPWRLPRGPLGVCSGLPREKHTARCLRRSRFPSTPWGATPGPRWRSGEPRSPSTAGRICAS